MAGDLIKLFLWPIVAANAWRLVVSAYKLDEARYGLHGSRWAILLVLPLLMKLWGRYAWARKERLNNCKSGLVYPHGDPIGIGWLKKVSKALREHQILQVWDNIFHTLGSTYWVNNIGVWMLMTNEPENVKTILSAKFTSWPIEGLRKRTTSIAVGPHGIFSVNGEEWHSARALIRPSFVRNQIADLECTDRHVDSFLKRIPRDGSAVDIQQLLFQFTMDVSTDFMFGYSTNMLEKPSEEALQFTTSFDYALLTASSRSRMGWIAFLVPDRRLDSSVKTCQRFIDHYVAEARSEDRKQERPYMFMTEMLASGASPEMVRNQLLAMILGGRDTSASTMSSLFWVLARRPDVVDEMRRDISRLEGRKPTWEELKELKYANMVLKETLRLWAPVASNLRVACEDTVLPKGGGPDGQSPILVPAGTGCRWSLHSLHRRKDVYGEDADEFRPERWETLRTTWEYLPFSGGPRICIGQQFALTMMLYLVTRILQEFERIEAADDEPMVMEVGTTIKLVNGCWVKLSPVKG